MESEIYFDIVRVFKEESLDLVVGFLSFDLIIFWFLRQNSKYVKLLEKEKGNTPEAANLALEKAIKFPSEEIRDDDIYPEGPGITRADDKFLILDRSGRSLNIVVYAGLAVVVLGLLAMIFPDRGEESIGVRFVWFHITLVGLALMFYAGFGSSSRKFVFNRMKGTITYPTFLFFSKTVRFKDARFVTGNVMGGAYLGILHTNNATWSNIAEGGKDLYSFWSLFVWYMDKNRPLPPGTAFDEFREKDYERRKVEGFPKPLYESSIPISEWESTKK